MMLKKLLAQDITLSMVVC